MPGQLQLALSIGDLAFWREADDDVRKFSEYRTEDTLLKGQ